MSNYKRATKLPAHYLLALGMLLGIPFSLPLGSYALGLPIGLVISFMTAIVTDRLLALRRR